jgi:hypothetical protein
MSQSDCSGKTLKLWPVFVDHFNKRTTTHHSQLLLKACDFGCLLLTLKGGALLTLLTAPGVVYNRAG